MTDHWLGYKTQQRDQIFYEVDSLEDIKQSNLKQGYKYRSDINDHFYIYANVNKQKHQLPKNRKATSKSAFQCTLFLESRNKNTF